MTPAEKIAAQIQESRRIQLVHQADAVKSLEAMLSQVAARIRASIRATPRGILQDRYRRQLIASFSDVLDTFRDQYKDLLDAGIIQAARQAEEREIAILTALVAERGALRPDQGLIAVSELHKATVAFGQVPQLVLERLYARTYQDGLNLSQRLYNLDVDARRMLAQEVGIAIASGKSARDLARAIEPVITQPGVDNVRYRAMRIARTEINVAYREGHIASVQEPGDSGRLKSYIDAIGWRLSPSHPRIDICDAWAGDDNGLGEGNYLPGDVPAGHPHCMCFTVSILADFPDEKWVSQVAYPEDVSEAQRRYYGLSKDDETDL